MATLAFPFVLLWDILLLAGVVAAQIAWLCALCGSLVGFLIVLLFCPPLFLWPLWFLAGLVHPWLPTHARILRGEEAPAKPKRELGWLAVTATAVLTFMVFGRIIYEVVK